MKEVSESSTHFERQKPQENEDLLHKIVLNYEGRKIGEASLEYRNQPFPFYYLDMIYIDDKKKGEGLGAALFDQVNAYLDEHKKPGILINVIADENPARNMYLRHGWANISNHKDWMGYKLDGIDPAQVEKAIYDLNRRTNRMYEKPLAA